MLTTAITAAIVGALNILGVSPDPVLIGAIWVAVKAAIVGLGLLGGARLLQRARKQDSDA
ncbi:MAG: hypothetical protein VKQ33_09505 [Candidatus Sericytochromatia bacterium]|nr:hypothetical protein [Candidatus Sericytochromatia bacterium]